MNARSVATQVFADILEASYFIAAAAAIALVLGFVWLVLMRYFSGIIVWFTIILVYVLVIGFTIFLVWKGEE
jgi:fatty acid desaturase